MLNTLVHEKPVSMGLQWAIYVATDEYAYMHKGPPRIQNPELIDSFVNEVVLA